MSDQPELPGLPEAPEAPGLVIWGRWLSHYILGDPVVLKQSWRVIVLTAVVLAALARWIDSSLYEGKINELEGATATLNATIQSKDATIQNQSNTITQMQEELKGTSPQLAAIQAGRDAIRKQLQDFYVEAGSLYDTPIKNKADLAKVVILTNEWSVKVKSWAVRNMGAAATSKIFDQDSFSSRIWPDAVDPQEDNLRIFLLEGVMYFSEARA